QMCIIYSLYTVQMTFEEVRAAVEAAADYGTYVMAHLYTNESMQRAIRAGVMSLEHTQLMDDETARMIRDNGVWVCPCPAFTEDSMMDFKYTPDMLEKYALVRKGVEQQTELIVKYGLNMVFGTDMATNKYFCEEHQLKDFSAFKKRFGSFEGLRAATGRVHDLFQLCTYRNPYPKGKVGVLEPGSFADLLLIQGNPVEDLDLLTDKDNMKLIMKGGTIYKNTL
ncbi:MAG: amidohydrolase family protein, partial [Oscillospiraceae bacterium]